MKLVFIIFLSLMIAFVKPQSSLAEPSLDLETAILSGRDNFQDYVIVNPPSLEIRFHGGTTIGYGKTSPLQEKFGHILQLTSKNGDQDPEATRKENLDGTALKFSLTDESVASLLRLESLFM